jgi:error-prone DNA polymerase
MNGQMRDRSCSPPPCGEALGIGINHGFRVCGLPPSLTLPRAGGGNEPARV